MSNLMSKILQILKTHQGKQNAISCKDLSEEIGIHSTDLRKKIKRLIEEEGVMICSSIRPPVGYYLAVTKDEAQEYANQLKRRIRGTARRLRAFEKNTARDIEGVFQTNLF